MMPGRYPLAIYRGDSGQWRFILWLDTARTQPYDLTGVTPKAEIRDRPGGAQIIPLGALVTLPNIIDVDLNAGGSELLPQQGAWDLQLTHPDAKVTTIIAGDVTVVADVTNSDATTWASDRQGMPASRQLPPRLVPVPKRAVP